MKMMIAMDAHGLILVPVVVREALHIDGPMELELEVTPGAFILRPAEPIPPEDVWAYTPDHLRRIEEAREDARAGRVRQLTEGELKRLASEQT
jgi:bifunctional DNA-binding transcriptional regulator/antitoxin component of YhaV-PrlF toxin-antitoxin module